jgi:hypothetical protein
MEVVLVEWDMTNTPQVQGIDVTPLNVEVLGIEP